MRKLICFGILRINNINDRYIFIIFHLIRCEPLNHEVTNLNGKDKDHHSYLYEHNGHKSHIQRYDVTGHKSQISVSPALNQTMICNEGFIFDQHTLNCIGTKSLKSYKYLSFYKLYIYFLISLFFFFYMNLIS